VPCFRKRAAYALAQELERRQRLVTLDRLLSRAEALTAV
jgi:hypothetical protein